MTKSDFDVSAETDLGYGQLFAVLLRQRFWLLGIFCSVLSITAIIALAKEPTYQSSMQLLVEPNYPEQEKSGQDGQSANAEEIDYATQLNLMRSSQLIQRAVDLLHPEYPAIDAEEIKESLILTQLIEKGDSGEVDTKIFQVDYTDNDPVKTQKVLGAFQQVYQSYNLEQQKLRLTGGLAFVDDQLPRARQSVIQAERALEEFRKSYNLVDPEQQVSSMTEALNATQQQRRAIRMQRQDIQAQYDALQKQTASSPTNALLASRLSQSSRYQTLLNEIQRTELILAQQRQRFTSSNPVVRNLAEQRQDQLRLLRQEMERVLGKDSAQLRGMGGRLLSKGQLGGTDLDLAAQLTDVQKKLSGLKASEQSLAKSEQRLRTELNQFPGLIAEYNRLQPEIQIRRNTLQQLLTTRQQLGLENARGGFTWQVVEAPQPGWKTGPNTTRDLLLGGVVGLMLGGIVAFAREAIDDAVHTSDELKKQVALPLLGMVPELSSAEASGPIINLPFHKPQVIAPSATQPMQWLPLRESLDLIYKNIQLLNSIPLTSLVITSALAGEGKTTLALGLAISAARLHQRVLLIDADLRRPNLHKQLNLPNDQGLSTLLAGDTAVPSPIDISPSGSNIDILTAGPIPMDPVKLLSSQRMKELMAAFEQTYDLVLLDAPPVLGMVDAIQVASFCTGVVMVGRIGRVTQTELAQATTMLSKLNVIGVIANGVNSPTYGYTPYTEQRRKSIFSSVSNS